MSEALEGGAEGGLAATLIGTQCDKGLNHGPRIGGWRDRRNAGEGVRDFPKRARCPMFLQSVRRFGMMPGYPL
jgi:hypothetical protein